MIGKKETAFLLKKSLLRLFRVSGCYALGLSALTGFAGIADISSSEAACYRDYLLPLPHRISLAKQWAGSPKDVSVATPDAADDIAKSAADEVREQIRKLSGEAPSGQAFKIVVGVPGEDGTLAGTPVKQLAALKTAPNADQAYAIEPAGDNALLVYGLTGKGARYGAVTLNQLLEAKSRPGELAIPLAEVLDWPDLAERGVWNGGKLMVPHLAAMKLNFTQEHRPELMLKRGENGPIVDAKIDAVQWNAARLMAFNLVPEITHLNFLDYTYKIYAVYPELRGKGDNVAQKVTNPNDALVCPCASNPLLVDVLAGWMSKLAAVGVRDMTVWTSEYSGRCDCAKCAGQDQFVLETRAIVNAWKRVRAEYPDFRIRVFLGFNAKPELFAKVLSEIPAELGIERACYRGSEDQFNALVAAGRKVYSYRLPFVGNYLGFNVLPQKNGVAEMVKNKWSGAYALLGTTNADYNKTLADAEIAAIAEWGWNVDGRDAKQFARAWATRRGYDQPEKFAEWAEIMAPIEAVLYDVVLQNPNGWAKCAGQALSEAKNGKTMAGWTTLFRCQPFDANLAACQTALALAKTFKSPEWAVDTQLAIAYLNIVAATHELVVNAAKGDNPVALQRLSVAVESLKAALRERTALVPKGDRMIKRYEATAKQFADFAAEIKKIAQP